MIVRFGATGPDASFTAAGIAAWIRTLQADQSVSPPPDWTFPDQDATILYQSASASLSGLTLTGQAQGSPSLVGYRLLAADDDGVVSALATAYHKASYSGTGGVAKPTLVLSAATAVYTRTDVASGGLPAFEGVAYAAPTSDGYGSGASLTGVKGVATKQGSQGWDALQAGDFFATNSGTGHMLSLNGAAFQAQNNAAALIDFMCGSYHAVRMTDPGARATDMVCALMDPTTDGSFRHGYADNYYGLKISGMTLDTSGSPNNTFGAGNRYLIYLGAAAGSVSGSPGGNDYAVFSAATQLSSWAGGHRISNNEPPSFTNALGTAVNTLVSGSVSLSSVASTQAIVGDAQFAMTSGSPGAFTLAGVSGVASIGATDDRAHNAGSQIVGGSFVGNYAGRGNGPAIIGVSATANKTGPGLVTGMVGLSAGVNIASPGGSVTLAAAINVALTYAGSGSPSAFTVTLSNGITISRPVASLDVTLTSSRGVNIEDQTPAIFAAMTNASRALRIASQTGVGAYAIEQLGTDDLNVFMGPIKVGGSADRGGSPNQTSTNSIDIFNTTAAPIGTLSGATIYASGGKLFAMDGNGVPTQLTP